MTSNGVAEPDGHGLDGTLVVEPVIDQRVVSVWPRARQLLKVTSVRTPSVSMGAGAELDEIIAGDVLRRRGRRDLIASPRPVVAQLDADQAVARKRPPARGEACAALTAPRRRSSARLRCRQRAVVHRLEGQALAALGRASPRPRKAGFPNGAEMHQFRRLVERDAGWCSGWSSVFSACTGRPIWRACRRHGSESGARCVAAASACDDFRLGGGRDRPRLFGRRIEATRREVLCEFLVEPLPFAGRGRTGHVFP